MRKIVFVTSFLICVFSANAQNNNLDAEIEKIITPLISSINSQNVKNVALLDFTNLDGTSNQLSKYMSEEFSYFLVNFPKKSFSIVDASRISSVLEENGLRTTGSFDPNSIAKIGKVKGIDVVIVGTMTAIGNSLRLFLKVWNLETQTIVAASRGDISKTPMIIEMESKTKSIDIGRGPGTVNGLDGRGVQSAPKLQENSQSEGRVVLNVCVNSSGNVVSAEYKVQGSTTTDQDLINAAIRNARQYKFAPGSAEKQCGTITYNFKLR